MHWLFIDYILCIPLCNAPDQPLWFYFNASSSIHYLMQQKDKMSEHKIGQIWKSKLTGQHSLN